jgi:radical SAM protein with 4Fe4S-binding SPASM domain
MTDNIWILNPDYSFKNDGDRICMYAKNECEYDSSNKWIGYIHPMQAMILGIFTSGRPLSDLCLELSKKLNISLKKLMAIIKEYMGNETPIYTEIGKTKVLFPKNVLIPGDDIDLDKVDYSFSIEDLQCSGIDLTPDRSHHAPHSALWMLTNACATNCKYCYADRRTKYEPLTTEQIINIIDEFHSLKMQYVDIIGGEVFLCKDWNIILKRLVDYGMSPSFISTKFPINKEISEKLVTTKYKNVIQISLDSMKDETLSEIIGTHAGYINRIKDGIAILEELGYPIQINTVLTAKNSNREEISSLYNYVKTIKKLHLWEIRVPELSLYTPKTFAEIRASRAELKNIQEYVTTEIIPNALIKIIFSSEALDEKFRQDGPDKACFNGGSCGILQNRIFILPDGKVSVCEQMYWHKQFIIGDLKTQSIENIWNSERAITLFNRTKSIYRPGSICCKCSYFTECNNLKRRCFVKVVKAYGLSNWDYPDPRCEYAPEIQTNLKY